MPESMIRCQGKFMEQAASLGLYVMVPLTRGDWGRLARQWLALLRIGNWLYNFKYGILNYMHVYARIYNF